MTPIEKSVSRGCPDIVNDEGRCLDATLRDDNGGSLVLKWRGLRKPSECVFPLKDIMEGKSETSTADKPAPAGPVAFASANTEKKSSAKGVDPTEYLAYREIISKLHILPDIDLEDRARLIDIAADLQLHALWMSEETDLSFEAYKERCAADKLFINQQ